MAQILFLFERLEREIVEMLVEFLSLLDFEGMWGESTTPSSTRTYVCLLRENAFIVCRDIFEVGRTFPIRVPIAFCRLSISDESISTSLHKNAEFIAINIVFVGDDRDDREFVIPTIVEIRTCDNWAWQFAVLEEAESENGGVRNVELPRGGSHSVFQCWCCSVGRIAQGGACRNPD